jgi:DNA-binding response OmpR family regulator
LNSHICYIDDSQLNLDHIKTVLAADFTVDTFQHPDAFLKQLEASSYAALLVDIHMPEMDGFSLYEKIIAHPNYNGCPILFISSDDSDHSRIRSLELGAVDFLARNTPPDEMIARVKSRILFYKKHRSIIEFSSLKVNLTQLKAYVEEQEVPLTFMELKLLCYILRNYPEAVSKEQLVAHIWKASLVLDATIYTHISNLNGKLEAWDHEILGIKSRGFILAKKGSNP